MTRKLTDLLSDPDKDLRAIKIPEQYLHGVPPTTFFITRLPFAELIALEDEMVAERRRDKPNMNRFFSNEIAFGNFKKRLVRVMTGGEEIEIALKDINKLPETWKRHLTRETIEERNEGFEMRGQLGEL